MNNTPLAPIVLFVYNRPWHIQQTVEALQKNELASESELFIYSDAAKNEIIVPDVKIVRSYIKQITGFKKITIIEREKNWGLANSIIDGVTTIINQYGKIIVLEDDLVTTPYFLKFMNEALSIYQESNNVGMIHGHIYNILNLPDLFFLKKSGCLGWGTWDRVWNDISFDGTSLLHEIKNKKLEKEFDINNSYPYLQMLSDQINEKNNSWAIRVYACFFVKGLLTFYPSKSFVQHIGFDTGTHCNDGKYASDMDGKLFFGEIPAKFIDISSNTYATKKLESFYKKQKSIPYRIIRKIKNWMFNS